jgi:hypothetical protein
MRLIIASFSLIVYSCSVALQALAVISIGVLADDRTPEPHSNSILKTGQLTFSRSYTLI